MPTILAIDDDASALSALASTLESEGHHVERSPSIDQARHFLDEHDPDLIILEVAADDGAGWNLLRDIVRFEGPPTIVVTRRGREEEVVEALSSGAADVLTKPFRSAELIARVRTRLRPRAPTPPPAPPPPRIAPRADEGPVFISHADEQSLMEPPEIGGVASLDEENLPLGARLHTVRQRRRLTLVQVNLDTKVPIWYLQAMEEEKFSMLPRGPAAIEMVRTYAEYLGLDGNRAVADYRAQHDASPFKPIPSLGGAPEPREIPPWLGIAVAAALALALGLGGIWYVAGNRVPALASNIRGLVVRPTATLTPSPTAPPTITPTATRTPTTTPTVTPTATPTVAPSATTAPLPPATVTAGP